MLLVCVLWEHPPTLEIDGWDTLPYHYTKIKHFVSIAIVYIKIHIVVHFTLKMQILHYLQGILDRHIFSDNLGLFKRFGHEKNFRHFAFSQLFSWLKFHWSLCLGALLTMIVINSSGDAVSPIRRYATAWSNDDPDLWCHMASLGLNG